MSPQTDGALPVRRTVGRGANETLTIAAHPFFRWVRATVGICAGDAPGRYGVLACATQ
jgi:hypothetical protein